MLPSSHMFAGAFRSNAMFVPRILRLQPEIGGMFVDEMDIMSLLQWRLTCKTNYYQAVGSLKRSVVTMLDHFVPNPPALLTMINRTRCVMGGEFALAFILRDPSMIPKQLDLYVGDHDYNALCTSILENPDISRTIIQYTCTQNNVLDALRTLVSSVLVIETTKGTFIHIHRSYTPASTAPISRASCTALSNFVTGHGFGCSHPILTLNRRALLADQELPQLPDADSDLQDRLIRHDFSLAFSPIAWAEFRRPANTCVPDDASNRPRDAPGIPRPVLLEGGLTTTSGTAGATAGGHQMTPAASLLASNDVDGDQAARDGSPADPLRTPAIASPPARNGDENGRYVVNTSSDDVPYGHNVVTPSALTTPECDLGAYDTRRTDVSRYLVDTFGSTVGRSEPDGATLPTPSDINTLPDRACVDGDDAQHMCPFKAIPDMLHDADASTPLLCVNGGEGPSGVARVSGLIPRPADIIHHRASESMGDNPPAPDAEATMPRTTTPLPSRSQRIDFSAPDVVSSTTPHPPDTRSSRAGGDVDPGQSAHGNVTSNTPRASNPSTSGIDTDAAVTTPYIQGTTTSDSDTDWDDDIQFPLSGDSNTAPWRRWHALNLHCIRPQIGNGQATDVDELNGAVEHAGQGGLGHDTTAAAHLEDASVVGTVDEDSDRSSTSDTATTSDDEGSDDDSGAETEHEHTNPEQCWRHLYICPSQGRYFGDRGSFVDFFDPLSGCEAYCAVKGIAPFGPMVVWRVLSTFDCEEGCDIYDDVLEEGVTSIPVIFRKDPFGDLRNVISDHLVGG